MKDKVMNGLKWSLFAKLITQILSWISTFVVIRILTPEDYGIVAIVMVFFSFIAMFSTNGFSATIVQKKIKERKINSQVFTLSLGINLVLSLFMLLSASFWSDYYHNPHIEWVIIVMAIVNPIASFAVVPNAYLTMDMNFKIKAKIDSYASLLSMVLSLSMALMGFAFWALILSNLMATLLRMVLLNKYTKPDYGLTVDFNQTKALFGYSIYIQLSTFIWFFYNKIDSILIAQFLGMKKLGFYNTASEIASIPMTKVSAILNEVSFAAFANLKDDQTRAINYIKKATRIMGVVSFPVFMGIALVTNEVVTLLLGDKWQAAAPVMTILCLVFPFRMLTSILNNFAAGMGDAKFNMQNSFFIAIVMLFGIYIGVHFDLNGVAYAWSTSFFIVYLYVLRRFHKKYAMPYSTLFAYLKSAVWSWVMFVSIYLLDKFYLSDKAFALWQLLLIKIVLGVLIILPVFYRWYGQEIRELLRKN